MLCKELLRYCLKSLTDKYGHSTCFNEYKAVTYMYQYFSKTEDQCSYVIKQANKEAVESNMHHHDTIKTFSKAS